MTKKVPWSVLISVLVLAADWIVKPLTDTYVQKYLPTMMPAMSTIVDAARWLRPYVIGAAIAVIVIPLWKLARDVLGRQPIEVEPAGATPLGPVYLGWPALSMRQMRDREELELAIFAFNAHKSAIRFVAVNGVFYLEGRDANGPVEPIELVPPIIIYDRGPLYAEPSTEFLVILRQPLTSQQVATAVSMLEHGPVTLRINDATLVFEQEGKPETRAFIAPTRSPNVRLAMAGDELQNTTVHLRMQTYVGPLIESVR